MSGLRLGERLTETGSVVLNWHLTAGTPIKKATIAAVFRCFHLSSIIQATVESRWLWLLESLSHAEQKWSAQLLKMLEATRASLNTEKSVDALSLLGIGERALAGPLSLHRLRLAQLCLNLAALPRHLRSEDVDAISLLLRRMIIVREAVSRPRLFDTSCLVFHSALLPTLLDSCLNESGWAQRLPGITEAISGGGWLLDSARHCDLAQIRKKSRHFSHIFQEELVVKVCSAAEVELRLSTHTHLQLDDRNPYSAGEARPGLDALLRLPPLRLLTATLHLRSALTAYLTRTFYNLSAVALTDWPRYAEMGGVAEARLGTRPIVRWGLDLKPPALPAHAVSEAGLDLLQITRHLPVFLAKYHYHINSQTFIEKSSKSRHLNTLGLEQVSKSLRAHGTGIMNTTVNFTYQFLRKKFYVFSQFLYDDQIKSRLQKDARFFKEHKDELNGKYPMERAKKMNSGIRRLGLTGDGRSYLDQFRGLVTEIGNALGYVRLLRSAGLVVGAEAVEFLPDLDDVVSVRPLIDAAACFGTTAKDAADHLDGLVQDILTSTSTNYFKVTHPSSFFSSHSTTSMCIELLVDVFSEQFRDPKHVHLRNFYAMVPPLVVNFVEEAVGRRERMGKRAVDGDAGSFTDDGFVMGLAYILRLLDQYDAFDSLQWFKSVKATFKAEKADYTAQKSGVGGDAKLGATLELSLRRLCEYEREYDLVRFGLRSARIFFRTDLAEGLTGPVDDKSDTRSLASQGSRHTES